jgi:serine phosphatase RsbU (regulator of sigma subunit)
VKSTAPGPFDRAPSGAGASSGPGWVGDQPAADHRLEPLIDTGLVHLQADDLLAELLHRARDVLHTDTAAVLLLDETAQHLIATAASGLEEEVRQGVRIPLGHGFAGRIAAEQRPVIIDHVDHANVVNPHLLSTGVRSLLGVPLLAGGQLLGVLHVGTLTARRFTEEDARLLQVVADRAALATQARLSSAERAAAAALQRSLLPTRFPRLPGLELAGRYLPGDRGGVGGDWYDVFVLPTGQLAVAIGDAMGHGLHAAVVMSRLRSTLRAYAIESTDPADVLTRLDRKLQHFEPNELATVLYGIFEPSLERIHLSSAGHPAPVVAHAGGGTALAELAIDPPIGAPTASRRVTTTVALPAGSLLLCYTDGLVERRGTSLDRQLQRLTEATFAGPPELVCSSLTATLLGADPPHDDVAVLAARRRPGHGTSERPRPAGTAPGAPGDRRG